MARTTPSLFLALLAALGLFACAHSSVKKFEYPATTNATTEIDRLETEMASAQRNQVNVLSPNHYSDARKKLDEAKKENQKTGSNTDTLEDLGYARAHLDTANSVASRVEAAVPEIVKARSEAMAADAARYRNSDLVDADKHLIKLTSDFESGNPSVSVEDRAELQKRYNDVEVVAMKTNYLGDARTLIDAAKKMRASKYAGSTLASAEVKYQSAERTIENDRHNTGAVVRDSDIARSEAKHLMEITRLARGVKEQSPEEAAIALDAKRREAESANSRLQTARNTIQDKNSEITTIGAEKSQVEADKNRLAEREQFNQAFATAQQSFSKSEAEVYRQGDNLVVRLKAVQFPTGRAELPGSSMTVLNKVKDVIASLSADHVLVEGHTDATGSKAKNLTLSEKRAEAVAEYFVAENAVPQNQVESKGFGDTRPLMSNKSKTGRAQNRRVDIVISPKSMPVNTTSSDSGMNTSQSSAISAPTQPKASQSSDSPSTTPKRWDE